MDKKIEIFDYLKGIININNKTSIDNKTQIYKSIN